MDRTANGAHMSVSLPLMQVLVAVCCALSASAVAGELLQQQVAPVAGSAGEVNAGPCTAPTATPQQWQPPTAQYDAVT